MTTPRAWTVGARVAWWLTLATVVAATLVLGHGRLASPPLDQPARWGTWWMDEGPVDASFAVLRVAVALAGGYLALLGFLAGAIRALSSRRLLAVMGLISTANLRRVAFASVGVATVASPLWAGSMAMAAPGPGHGPPVLRLIEPGPVPQSGEASGKGSRGPTGGGGAGGGGGALSLGLPPASTRPSVQAPSSGGAQGSAPPTVRTVPGGSNPDNASAPGQTRSVPPQPVPLTSVPPPDTAQPDPLGSIGSPEPGTPANSLRTGPPPPRVVQPGDSLWSIAESTLVSAWGHSPDEASLARYWWQVVRLNRARLPDPSDADLIFPGMVVNVPPPPPSPSA